MAINDMIMPGLKNPLLLMAEEIRKQISQKALEPPKTSPPIAGMPEDRDYTEGMERPELTTLKSEREFKATPAKTSAFLVALGNIFQDKQNLEAAKQQAQQSEYNAKLSDAMELNKLFKTGKIKREFDESDPDTQLRREAMQLEIAQKREMGPLELAAKKAEMEQRQEMYPLEKQKTQAYIDSLLGKTKALSAGKPAVKIPGLTPEQQQTYDSFLTKSAKDSYAKTILTPDKVKEEYAKLRNQNTALAIDLKEMEKQYKMETNEESKAIIANRYRASEQQLQENDLSMRALEDDYNIKVRPTSEIKKDIPEPSSGVWKNINDKMKSLFGEKKNNILNMIAPPAETPIVQTIEPMKQTTVLNETPTRAGISMEAQPAKSGVDIINATSGIINHGKRKEPIDKIVLHSTGSEAAGESSVKDWFKTNKKGISAHYFVSNDGKIIQLVDDNNVAWHGNAGNKGGIGIEVQGETGLKEGYKPAQTEAVAKLIKFLRSKHGKDLAITTHSDFNKKNKGNDPVIPSRRNAFVADIDKRSRK